MPPSNEMRAMAIRTAINEFLDGELTFAELRSKTAEWFELPIPDPVQLGVFEDIKPIPSYPLTPKQALNRCKALEDRQYNERRVGLIVKVNAFLVEHLREFDVVTLELDRRDGWSRELVDDVMLLFQTNWRFEVKRDESSKTRIRFFGPRDS